MFENLPESVHDVMDWEWSQFEPYFDDLAARPLSAGTVEAYLNDWTRVHNLVQEVYARLHVQKTLHTDDEEAARRYNTFLETIFPPSQKAEQLLKDRLLASGLEPDGFAVLLRNIKAESLIFAEANLPLKVEERKLASEYDKLIAAQTVGWQGEELTITQLTPLSQTLDRADREQVWRLASERVLDDRAAINEIWVKLLGLRRQICRNAGLRDYREYAWYERLRFDYTPEDAETFHRAIEDVVVPAARRVYERRARRLGVDALRPWDINVNVMRTTDLLVEPPGSIPLRPFRDVEELKDRTGAMFHRVDPALGGYFDVMRREDLLDLANYKGKAPGAYCMTYPASRRPFVFHNAVGVHDNVDTMLHECGHAFHVFEKSALPYFQQWQSPMEFNEVASMAMELLAAPYLLQSEGGFYTEEEAARVRIDHLEQNLIFWPYMAVVDAFQHWAYTHDEDALDPAACDAAWGELWDRFIDGVDWSGLNDYRVTGWQRKLHIFRYPFYYIEYGLAQAGAVQVWRNALADQAGAVAAYRRALALGGVVTLPELFSTAGARFGFDAGLMAELVDLMEGTINNLS
jgi:oligoendopeptidase F